jgi:glutamate-ammonia-ligase adenylyltransferase
MLQLAHGHRLLRLRQRETLKALKALHEENILRRAEYPLLADGYLFLRRLDHRLRLERDQSIDAFEASPGRLEGIAKALGYGDAKSLGKSKASKSGAKLLRDYRSRREKIRACYERYFRAKSLPAAG